MAFVGESGLTVDTRIRFLSSVHSNMSLIAIFVMKLLGTVVTRKLPVLMSLS